MTGDEPRAASRPLVALYLGAGWEKWDETSLDAGIGGAETAAIWVGRELAQLGYAVKIFADPWTSHRDAHAPDVEYLHWESFESFARARDIDVLVCSRTLDPLRTPCRFGRCFVWMHDAVLSGDPAYDVCLDRVSAYLCLSEWHRELVHAHHGIPLERIVLTSNGVDPERYASTRPRHPHQVVYCSSPDRGLDTLLYCGEFVARFVEGFRVVVAYGFENWEKAVLWRGDPAEVELLESTKKALAKPFVRYVGRIGQRELAALQQESSGWFYPTRCYETFCISAVEAGFAGLPILSSRRGGLVSTVGDAGLLLDGDAYTKEYREEFVYRAIQLSNDRDFREAWAERARERMRTFTWRRVALQWHALFEDGARKG